MSDATAPDSILYDYIEHLRTDLIIQWESNHAQHCGAPLVDGECPTECKWPPPRSLGGNRTDWRPYEH